MILIIGLTGRKHHGKFYFCKFLQEKLLENGCQCIDINFKDPLYDMARSIGWNGEKDYKGRKLLQRLGTEVVRECIDENYWVKHWVERVEALDFNTVILVDDIRFKNEAEIIKSYHKSLIVHVMTPSQDTDLDNHISEAGIPEFYVDVQYVMEFGLEYIRQAVEEFYVTYLVKDERLRVLSG